ncbi:hemagglutinin [Buchananella hordeovulneris]|uniref:hemagglutinin n=1 Tax=Buchananella hordeovulneris TaxID=52770 RepID=UPI000F5DA6F6|nr:hemagglutinin [Buchananella hordeovulneris]MDO5081235.1 hemagglutinin [Buchananella hordeovulneris]RRD52063.1 hemagglutinin [Buchananella hordeovulneris]
MRRKKNSARQWLALGLVSVGVGGAVLWAASWLGADVARPPRPVATFTGTQLDFTGFDPARIIDDEVFFDSTTMTAAEIDQFLTVQGEGCQPGSDGTPCLAHYVTDVPAMPANEHCAEIADASNMGAAEVISQVATACEVNPEVLLVLLQKEQGLVTASGRGLEEWRYASATGYGCPDGATCAGDVAGFFNQVYRAAWQFQRYRAYPEDFDHVAGVPHQVGYHPRPECGGTELTISNQATAGLYNYTPYQPDPAALAGLEGACASHGNLNFYAWYKLWFGSPYAS